MLSPLHPYPSCFCRLPMTLCPLHHHLPSCHSFAPDSPEIAQIRLPFHFLHLRRRRLLPRSRYLFRLFARPMQSPPSVPPVSEPRRSATPNLSAWIPSVAPPVAVRPSPTQCLQCANPSPAVPYPCTAPSSLRSYPTRL